MMTICTILGAILCAFVIILFGCFIFTIQYLIVYHCHRCPHCRHFMKFKGFKEDDRNGHFLFHCPKCGAWESIPKEDIIDESGLNS